MDARFYSVKDEIRLIGFDDGPFSRDDRDVLVVGTVFRGGKFMDGAVSTKVSVDGCDATDKLLELIKDLRFKDVRIILLDGIAFGGFNVVDINRLFRDGGLPVIVVTRDLPDFAVIEKALSNLSDGKRRYETMMAAGHPRFVQVRDGSGVHIQCAGIDFEDASKVVRLSATRSLIPEPIRCAHLITQAIVLGQSRGKA